MPCESPVVRPSDPLSPGFQRERTRWNRPVRLWRIRSLYPENCEGNFAKRNFLPNKAPFLGKAGLLLVVSSATPFFSGVYTTNRKFLRVPRRNFRLVVQTGPASKPTPRLPFRGPRASSPLS